MKIFESFDEREKAIENAAGNLAFKVFWCLMLITLIVYFYMIYILHVRYVDALAFIFYGIVIDMLAALCVKYFYCWTHDIDKKILIWKFARTFIGSFIFVFIFAYLFYFYY